MYAIKQAMLLSGALPLADITIYFMDIRAFGKGYEQFFQNAMAMGIQFVRGKVASIDGGEDGKVLLRYEAQDAEGGVQAAEHDLVVLSLGMTPGWAPREASGVTTASDGFIRSLSPKVSPVTTNVEGVFAAGAALGPKDIVDTIVEAGAAAMAASRYLRGTDGTRGH
jgi:heterodisulfide reductase subunit A